MCARIPAFLAALLLLGAALPPPAAAGFGSPVLARGRFGLGIVGRQFIRNVYDVSQDQISNPSDRFGYVALAARMGLWRQHVDLGLDVGKAHRADDRFPDRDYVTYELGVTLRGGVRLEERRNLDLVLGVHLRESVGFDRGPTLTHKLRRHVAVFGLLGRRLALGGRAARGYGGPVYSRHEFEDYGGFFRPGRGPGEGETRGNLRAMGGMSVVAWPVLEVTGEVTARDLENFTFGLTGLLLF